MDKETNSFYKQNLSRSRTQISVNTTLLQNLGVHSENKYTLYTSI